MIRHISFQSVLERVGSRRVPLAAHSAEVSQGCVFVVLPPSVPRGTEAGTPGGERYLARALEGRPSVVVCDPAHIPLLESLALQKSPGATCEVVACPDPRAALGALAREHYGTGAGGLMVVGITGTNGKTTETYLLEALFSALGRKCGVIGTVSYRWPGHEQEAPLTTPGCLALHEMLARMREAGAGYAFMEVSSHALDQDRVAGIDFGAALMTNLTQDHLDYHQGMEDYFAAKERLFLPPERGGLPLADKVVAVNADDPYGRRLLERHPDGIGFGLGAEALPGSRHLSGRILSLTPNGLRLECAFEGRRWELFSPLVGRFNAMNLLGAQAVALGLGLGPEDFTALSDFTGVSGRLERIPCQAGPHAFVDYAHTPDALVKALSALREAGFSRIITVFGCGGNRDRGKRPLMGEAVASLSDVAVLTSDNPRDEDPEAIMADVLPGLAGCASVIEQPDRRAAIAEAVALAGPRDAVLVAGKGHEPYQLIRGVKYPFSDQAVLRELLR